MGTDATLEPPPPLPRVPIGVPGLDAVLGGGLVAGDAYQVGGAPRRSRGWPAAPAQSGCCG